MRSWNNTFQVGFDNLKVDQNDRAWRICNCNLRGKIITKLVALAAMTAFLTMILAQGITSTYEYGIRSEVANIQDGIVTWDPQSFAGFYYDINSKTGTEMLTMNITNENQLSGDSPYGIVYTTTARPTHFKFNDFGSYNVIGFLGDKCFAGYVQDSTLPAQNQIPYTKSTDRDTLAKNQLFNVFGRR
jgi:hypothetical protein